MVNKKSIDDLITLYSKKSDKYLDVDNVIQNFLDFAEYEEMHKQISILKNMMPSIRHLPAQTTYNIYDFISMYDFLVEGKQIDALTYKDSDSNTLYQKMEV